MTKPLEFATTNELRRWFAKNHASASDLWLRLYKKGAGVATVTYAEALDQALCYGWIDAIKKSYDAESWLQRFCPRSSRSRWSKVNVKNVRRLTLTKQMAAPGIAAVNAAKEDGRWEAAYDSPATAELPGEFLVALKRNKKAHAFFQTLDRANLYAIKYRIQTSIKPETRQRWIIRIIEMLANRKTFHAKK